MVLTIWFLRFTFVLMVAAIGFTFVQDSTRLQGVNSWAIFATVIGLGFFVVIADVLSPRKQLVVLAGSFFGLLVGVVIAYALSFIVKLIVDQYATGVDWLDDPTKRKVLIDFVTLIVGVTTCYLSISFVLQTKDDFRFIIPYVEFAKDTKGNRPIVLDSSALIDGRIADIAHTGIFENRFIVPRFVLNELKQVSDSADRLKRNRGRRGLDVLKKLQDMPNVEVKIYQSTEFEKPGEVDNLIMRLAKEIGGRVMTTDFGLNRMAQVSGVDVINIHEIANAMKAEVLPGEMMQVRIVKQGEEANQGIGYMDDGTMVVVERGGGHINQDVSFIVTNTRQTTAGKMIFGRIIPSEQEEQSPPPDERRRPTRTPNKS
ncbi:MAG TPA: hypothetical protein PK402_04925 [Tepidisphaeraceae bacterium]|nr:hypothetical protein [Tepidisphaeraceae bacterium]